MRTAAPRDRLYELRTKVDRQSAEALKAYAEANNCTEYEATRRMVYYGMAAYAALKPNTELAEKLAKAAVKGTPSAESRSSRGRAGEP